MEQGGKPAGRGQHLVPVMTDAFDVPHPVMGVPSSGSVPLSPTARRPSATTLTGCLCGSCLRSISDTSITALDAEIDLLNLRVLFELRRLAFKHCPAGLQDISIVGDVEGELQRLLGEQERQAFVVQAVQ